MSRAHVTQVEFNQLLKNLGRAPLVLDSSSQSEKKHKYGAKSVVVDGHKFPSLLEARCYADLQIQWQGGVLTEPLRQVRFSLGRWHTLGAKKSRERFYIADFVAIVIRSGELIIVEAKGYKSREYLRKKSMILELYGICIREYRKTSR